MGWRGKCEMNRSLVIFTLEDHQHCKQLSGQDNLGNFVARKRLSMSICTTPSNNSKKNTLFFEQPPTMPRATLYLVEESISFEHRNDDHHEQDKLTCSVNSGALPYCAIPKRSQQGQRGTKTTAHCSNLRREQLLLVQQSHILTCHNRTDDNIDQIIHCIEDSALSVLKICNQLPGKGAQKGPCSDPLLSGHCLVALLDDLLP